MRPRLTEDLEADDPILSVVNLIDVFLVIIAALLLAVAQSPLSSFSADKLTVIRNPGAPDMEIIVKDGHKVERYKGAGGSGQGAGVKIGSAYRLPDGALVYQPD
jgi:hypothetical protein